MKDIKGKYTFVTSNGRTVIICTYGYAEWLVLRGRTHGGIFFSSPLKVYM